MKLFETLGLTKAAPKNVRSVQEITGLHLGQTLKELSEVRNINAKQAETRKAEAEAALAEKQTALQNLEASRDAELERIKKQYEADQKATEEQRNAEIDGLKADMEHLESEVNEADRWLDAFGGLKDQVQSGPVAEDTDTAAS